MPIDYKGPEEFSSIIKNAYQKIEGYISRQNPRIIVANPDIRNFEFYVDNFPGLPIEEYFCRLQRATTKMLKGSELSKEEEWIIYNRHSFELGLRTDTSIAGMYSAVHDDIIIPAILLIRCFGDDNVFYRKSVKNTIKHELVHFDIGDITPFRKARETYMKRKNLEDYIYNINASSEIAEILKKYHDIDNGLLVLLFKMLPASMKPKIYNKVRSICDYLSSGIRETNELLEHFEKTLEFGTLNECIAYLLGDVKFEDIPNAVFHDREKAKEFYNLLTVHRKKKGNKDTIKRVKEIGEKVWEKDISVTDLLDELAA